MQLWGLKTESWFDVWSIEHLLTGISLGGLSILLHQWRGKKLCNADLSCSQQYQETIFVLLVAFVWEALEHYLETGLLGERVTYWFQGVEFFGNRLITDPLLMLAGLYIARRYSWMTLPARAIGLIWLSVHVFIFEHSMVLHEMEW